jgi:hypothetical protein
MQLQACSLHVHSPYWCIVLVGAAGMQQLVKRHVQSPLQAQQAWQVAVRLQGHPLHKVCSRVLGGAVVSLVEVSAHHTGQQPAAAAAAVAATGLPL